MFTITLDAEVILEQISVDDLVDYFGIGDLMSVMDEDKISDFLNNGEKYMTVKREDADKYIDVDKSIGTDAFYDLLEKAIEEGKISLELLIGRIAVKKIMASAKNNKPE